MLYVQIYVKLLLDFFFLRDESVRRAITMLRSTCGRTLNECNDFICGEVVLLVAFLFYRALNVLTNFNFALFKCRF